MFLAFCSVGVCTEKMGVQQQNNCMSTYNTGENLLSSFSFETGFIYVPGEPSQGRFHCFKLHRLMPGAKREYYFTSCGVVEGQTLKGNNYELWIVEGKKSSSRKWEWLRTLGFWIQYSKGEMPQLIQVNGLSQNYLIFLPTDMTNRNLKRAVDCFQNLTKTSLQQASVFLDPSSNIL